MRVAHNKVGFVPNNKRAVVFAAAVGLGLLAGTDGIQIQMQVQLSPQAVSGAPVEMQPLVQRRNY